MCIKPVIDVVFRKPPAHGRRWENAIKKPRVQRISPVDVPIRPTRVEKLNDQNSKLNADDPALADRNTALDISQARVHLLDNPFNARKTYIKL